MIINSMFLAGTDDDDLDFDQDFEDILWTEKNMFIVEENIRLKPWDMDFNRGVWSDEDAQTKGVESLFIIGDKDKFIKLFKESNVAKNSMADVAEWLFDRDVTDPLQFVRETKSAEVDWKVMRSSKASVFYGQRNTDNYFHIVGVGRTETPGEDLLAIDNSFLPHVASLVARV